MKKETMLAYIIWLVIFAATLVVGYVVLNEYSIHSNLDKWVFVGFFFLAIITGTVFNAIVFELGHILGAKIGGYKITSVNILGLCFYKEDNKWKIGLRKYEGLTGETKIYPVMGKKKKPNPVTFNVMGTFLFGVEFLIVLFIFTYFKDFYSDGKAELSNMAYFLLVEGSIGALILIYNIMPLKFDSATDGYRLRLLSNKENKDAYNKLLLSEAGIEEIKEEEMEVIKETVFSGDMKLNNLYKSLDASNYDEVIKQAEDIKNDPKASDKSKFNAQAQIIFIKLMNLDTKSAKAFYDKEVPLLLRKDMAEDGSMTAIRTYVLMAGLMDKSQSECIYVLSKAARAYKHCSEGSKAIELKYLNIAIDRVMQEHSNWELETYKLFETK